MAILKIRKRNGNISDFDPKLITAAIAKAAQSAAETDGTQLAPDFAETIGVAVVKDLEKNFDSLEGEVPSVEQIQDTVERYLVESDNFEVAKRYILYRAEHARMRAESRLEELQKLERNLLKVTKSSGTQEVFDIRKVQRLISRSAQGLKFINEEALLEEVKRNVFDGISTKDVNKALVMASKAFVERDPEYSYLSARLLLNSIYREVFGRKFSDENLREEYQSSFIRNLKRGVEVDRINKELLTFDLDKITEALEPQRDYNLAYLGMQTLYDRYFIHIKEERIEAPQHFWMRVAMGLALAEKPADREKYAIEFYENFSNLRFISSTPTLFNSGTTHSQLSSCYLSTVNDSLEHIFKLISDNAQLSKWAGGIGNDWTKIRATGSRIHGTNGSSQGVIPFLKIANDTAVAVNQGGKRKGAVCAYLECWHFDYPEFLELRKNTGDERRRTHDMNTASWIPDLFMKRVEADGNWTLFSPDEVPELHDIYGKEFEEKYVEYERKAADGQVHVTKTIKAKDLWRQMITMLFETGHPWMTFKDPCNVRSPQDHCGVVHDSNLCTEITLNNSETETAVCNLGSINLSAHFDPDTKDLNRDLLAKTIKTAMRMLDNVIDINMYPTKETKHSNSKHRPVGLGMMGLMDLMYLKDINFDTDAAVEFSDELMEEISYQAILASSKLAGERGAYETFKGSKWDRDLLPIDTVALLEAERGQTIHMTKTLKKDWGPVRASIKAHGMRNSNTMAIAPTATISNIAGCVPCTEPIYKNLYVKSNMGGEFTVINTHLVEDLKQAGLWNAEMYQELKAADGSVQHIDSIPMALRQKYKEVFEINANWIIKHASARQKWLDQSQSTNIFYRGTSGREIADIYTEAWKHGLKTTYYLRTLAATQVEKSTVSAKGSHKRDFSTSTQNETTTADAVSTATATPTNTPVGSAASMSALLNSVDCEACQ